MAAETVRIQPQTHAKLKELAEEEGRMMTEVLEEAIDAYYRQRLLAGIAADYAKLRENPKAWQEEQAERKLWDKTLKDGLGEK